MQHDVTCAYNLTLSENSFCVPEIHTDVE